MMALDYIIKKNQEKNIPGRLVPVVRILVKLLISQKYKNGKFDFELLDLVELSDRLNGVVK